MVSTCDSPPTYDREDHIHFDPKEFNDKKHAKKGCHSDEEWSGSEDSDSEDEC